MSQRVSLVFQVMDAAAITSALGIEPTHVQSMRSGESLWILESACPTEKIETEEHFRALLAMLRPHWEKLVALSREHQPTFSCFVWCEEFDPSPAIVLSEDTLKAIVAVRGGLNIDV